MEDKCELKGIALRGALELASGKENKTADDVVNDAQKLHGFLVEEAGNKET